MNYSRIRISERINVPGLVTFIDSGNAIFIFSEQGATLAEIPGQGDVAESLRAFLNGSIVYPVVGNGLLDIPSGWNARHSALARLQEGPLTTGMAGALAQLPTTSPMEKMTVTDPNAVPSIDYDKVAARIQELKDRQ